MEEYQKQLDNVMTSVVTRKEFLQHIGLALVGLIGITSLLRNLHRTTQPKTAKLNRSGFGMGPYGR